jgi:streptomycin 6-kinase
LEQQWRISVGAALGGGTASYVASAKTETGSDAVVKVALPPGIEGHGSFDAELTTLQVGGPGYVRLIAHDIGRRALLMEKLGRSLGASDLAVETRLDAIVSTLRRAWVPADHHPLPTLETKGVWLADFIERTWNDTGQPCSQRAVEIAKEYATARAAEFNVDNAFVLHGDAHPFNTLADGDGGFRLIDPDGVIGEREYDLAIPLREVDARDLQPDSPRRARQLCDLVAAKVAADAETVWQWAFVERVSTGVLCARLGHHEWATRLLTVADEWAASVP